MADEKEPSSSTEVIPTAETAPRRKVRWSSATGKVETPWGEDIADAQSPDSSRRPVQWGGTEVLPSRIPDGEEKTESADAADGTEPVSKSEPAEKAVPAPKTDTDGPVAESKAPPATEASPDTGSPKTEAAAETTSKPEPVQDASEASAPSKRRRSLRSRLKGAKSKATEIPLLVFMAFVIAIVIKTFLVQAFFIPSTSMLPTLRTGDRVLVEKVSYRFTDPDRGDIVVFEKSVFGGKKNEDLPWYQDAQGFFRELLGLPTGTEEDYIKRIVAVSGDVVEYKGSPRKLFVNKERVPQDFIYRGRDKGSPTLTSADCQRLDMQRAGSGCRVPAGRVFVMGDNRGNSEDSRILGPIQEDKIVGRAFTIIWPPSDFGGL